MHSPLEKYPYFFCICNPRKGVAKNNMWQKQRNCDSSKLAHTTQPWYNLLLKLLIDIPVSLNPRKDILINLAKNQIHPLANKNEPVGMSNIWKKIPWKEFFNRKCWHYPQRLKTRNVGDIAHISSISKHFVMKNKLIQFQLLYSKL